MSGSKYFILINKMSDVRLLLCLFLNVGIGLSIFFFEKHVETNDKTLLLNILFALGILLGGFTMLLLNNGNLLYKLLLCVYTLACILGTYFSLKNYDDNEDITQKIRDGVIVFAVICMSIMVPMGINAFINNESDL